MASLMLRNMRQVSRAAFPTTHAPSRPSSTFTSSYSRPAAPRPAVVATRTVTPTTALNRFALINRAFSAGTPPPSQGPLNEGDAPGIIPRNELQATGREYREVLWKTRFGEEYYSREGATGHFGTMEDPVIIFSNFASRVVGCMGGHAEGLVAHELMWFELNRGRKHMCSLCGQVFKLAGDWLYDTNYECYEAEQADWMKLRVKYEEQMAKKVQESGSLIAPRTFNDPFAPKSEQQQQAASGGKSDSKGH